MNEMMQQSAAIPPDMPTAGLAPSFSDQFSADWEAIARTRNLAAEGQNQADWLQDQLDAFKTRTGETLPNPLRFRLGQEGDPAEIEQRVRDRYAIAGEHYPTDEEIARGGIEKARGALRRAAETGTGEYGMGARLGSLAAGMASAALDPLNAAAIALAPEGGLLLRAAGIGAGLAGVTSFEDILTRGYQRQVTGEFGAGDIAKEAAESFAMGAGSEFGFRGLGAAWRRLSPADQARAPLPLKDAGTVAEKGADLDAQAPFRGMSGGAAHNEAVVSAERNIIEGKPPQLPLAAEREAGARRGAIFYPGGRIEARYDLAESSDLVTSHTALGRINPDYPAELQPRDRTAIASLDQINDMASKFEPERMAPNSDANHGPPIVGPDNVVESGNGRTMAIRQMYRGSPDRAAAYRGWLENQGYDTSGYREPVLVARRLDEMTADQRAAFAQSLTGSGLRLNATEQALSDARFLTPQALDMAKAGAFDSPDNRDFVRGILAQIPQAERGAFVTARGTLSANGIRRLDAAMNARAFGDMDVVTRLYDHPDPNIKTIGHGMRESAVQWAQMRDAAARGDIAAGHDITSDLMSAVKDVMRARDERRPIWEILNQGDLLKSDISQLTAKLLFKDDEMTRLASQKDIAARLSSYAEGALQNQAGPRLLGEALTPEEILRPAAAKVGATEPHTAALVDRATATEALEKPKGLADEAVSAAAELDRMREAGKNLVFERDEAGNVTSGVIDKQMAALDAFEAAAKEVRGCAIGGGAE